jgi:hypothetical protein
MSSAQVILPKSSVFKPRETERAIQNALTASAKAIKVDLALPAATWSHKPKITISTPSQYTREIAVEDEVYAMLDEGTKAHQIKPRRGKVLAFLTPFRPKTIPNQLRSNKGSKGNVTVFSKGVRHPGTKARNWLQVAKKKWDKEFPTTLQRAIDSEFGG